MDILSCGQARRHRNERDVYKRQQFHSVTYGIDIWVRGDHVLIDHDGALGSKGQTSLSCQVGFWSDTDGQQHQVRGDRGAVLY